MAIDLSGDFPLRSMRSRKRTIVRSLSFGMCGRKPQACPALRGLRGNKEALNYFGPKLYVRSESPIEVRLATPFSTTAFDYSVFPDYGGISILIMRTIQACPNEE